MSWDPLTVRHNSNSCVTIMQKLRVDNLPNYRGDFSFLDPKFLILPVTLRHLGSGPREFTAGIMVPGTLHQCAHF